jgi:hypothetical protein
VDEAGHSGDAGAADSGVGADSRDRIRVNGWSTSESPWSTTGPALDEDDDEIPAWRRPSQEIRPFARQAFAAERPSGEIRQFPPLNQPAEVRPFASPPSPFSALDDIAVNGTGSGDPGRSADGRPPEPAGPAEEPPPPRWSDGGNRYADLLSHLSARGAEPTGAPARLRSVEARPGSLEDTLDTPLPNSAPPYPYEGDLDDSAQDAMPSPVRQRAAVPMERPRQTFPAVRPATPGGRRADRTPAESARHALEPTPPDGPPGVDQPGASAEPVRVRPSYDPGTFPRRLPYESAAPAGSAPPADPLTGYAAPTAYPGSSGRSAGDPGDTPIGEQTARALPQRVPAQPDVPTVPEPPSVEPSAETPALARIATHLRRGDVLSSQDRQEGFDVNAILAAVREVDGVRGASLRSTPAGAHSLRLDLAEGADPAEVSRQVARLLQDRMGLDAAMQGADVGPAALPPVTLPPVNTPPLSAFVPSQAGLSGRASVSNVGSALTPGEDLRRLPTAPQAGRTSVTEERPTSAPVSPSPAGSAVPPSVISAPPAPSAAPLASAGLLSADGTPSADGTRGAAEPEPGEVPCGPPRPLNVGEHPGPRVMIESVRVDTFGAEATVEVRLGVEGRTGSGAATGPAVDDYLMRLCAEATAQAVDELLAGIDHVEGPARCFIEHAAAVPFGAMKVAVVVMLLSCGGWVDKLAGSAVVTGDDRHAMVRATLAAVNRRLEALLS